ncbi:MULTISPECIES: carboxypeptidase-like regulatory domain-containing protein [Deferrisoma]
MRALPSALLLALLALVAACAGPPTRPEPGPAGRVEGRVSLRAKGFAGATVRFLPVPEDPTRLPEPAAEVTSGEAGVFRAALPPGAYLVLAEAPGLHGYFGRNPVLLVTRLDGLNLPLVPAHPLRRRPAAPGSEGVEGRVLAEGTPVAGARVFAYLDLVGGLRGPGYAVSEPTGPDGRFALPLPPGTYYLAARARLPGSRGRLHPGDRFGVVPELPLRLRRGERIGVDIETVELPSAERMARFRGATAVVEGRIVDPQGRPVPGLRACLYRRPEMLDRPDAFSEPTGPDGAFRIEARWFGPAYLGARQQLGGPPALDERIGFYRGPRGARIDLEPGGHLRDLLVVVPR